jgi:N-acetylglutamate synthase-like GNAT family acetyltransferase
MIVIKSPATREDFKAYYALRHEVLHPGQPKGVEKDDYEPISQHFMAVDDKTNKVVGVIKLHEKEPGVGQFSHLAVAPAYQSQGIGEKLMARVEETARKDGYRVLGCFAHLDTSDYFTKFGFQVTELPTLLVSTHQVVWMEKNL